MKILVMFGFVLFLVACSGSRTKTNCNSPCDDSLHSLLLDYYQDEDFDSINATDGFLPFAYLGIAGCTLHEVSEKFGIPYDEFIIKGFKSLSYMDSMSLRELSFVLRALNKTDPIDVYSFSWHPYENKDLYVSVYFIENCGHLIAVAGERLNERIHLME